MLGYCLRNLLEILNVKFDFCVFALFCGYIKFVILHYSHLAKNNVTII